MHRQSFFEEKRGNKNWLKFFGKRKILIIGTSVDYFSISEDFFKALHREIVVIGVELIGEEVLLLQQLKECELFSRNLASELTHPTSPVP